MWQDFAAALCLMLVIEGMMPFLAPARWRSLVVRLAEVDDKTMRLVGLISMLVGAGLLTLVRQ